MQSSLEIGRVLADRDGVTFRAQGTCMYPTLRPGDVLHIRSCSTSDARIGDIAVCRASAMLFSHRVIAKGEQEGRQYIITRSDLSYASDDDPTFDENLLGLVVSITRNGQLTPLKAGSYPWLVRRLFTLQLAIIEAHSRLISWVVTVLEKFQNNCLYQTIGQSWLKTTHPTPIYNVRVPLNATLGNDIYRQLKVDEFDIKVEWKGRQIERWTLLLNFNDDSESAAWATFVRDAIQDWQLEETHTRLRYRNLGCEELLLQQAKNIMVKNIDAH